MHRFYLPDAPASDNFECALGAEESQHAGRVLRLRAGDEVEAYMTFDMAYDDDVVGVVPKESAVVWIYTVNKVSKSRAAR